MRKTICGRWLINLLSVVQVFFIITALLFMQGCDKVFDKGELQKENFKTEYQAVLLLGGMGYFGKIEKIGTHYIEMTDIYYLQSRQNPDTKQIDNVLIKRGKELHGPDRMYLNTAHVIIIEPVAPDSKLGQSIKELKARGDK